LTLDPGAGDYEAKMVATELTESLRDALVARGFLGLDEAACSAATNRHIVTTVRGKIGEGVEIYFCRD
jgi:hypothetical protein